MYACNVYDLTKEFEENIIEETKDNVRRIRHHASLGLWCGNNELELHGCMFYLQPHSPQLRADYIKQFEYVLPRAVEEVDDRTFILPRVDALMIRMMKTVAILITGQYGMV